MSGTFTQFKDTARGATDAVAGRVAGLGHRAEQAARHAAGTVSETVDHLQPARLDDAVASTRGRIGDAATLTRRAAGTLTARARRHSSHVSDVAHAAHASDGTSRRTAALVGAGAAAVAAVLVWLGVRGRVD